ncbi:nucleoside-triphosphatase [Clostridium cavendishii DSM 21758]|uniref:Nucleoside-triphosphatase n=1 Tax=Clostridium cavendishii DSM 21758 TaxID=1121302 RepID=A0A1M6DKW8_9CLOT|nr:nucleoside-triphosphatase [Clostridium cavendishii]SHI73618.1 nucleoside-triphosphatase [Clostridium cavendishii DSM 21758]
MEIKNVFVTGRKKCGKSTLINNILNELNITYSGYRTLPYYINNVQQGFYIHGYIENENICKPISVKIQDYKMVPIIETFEFIGVDILKKSIEASNSKLILLDEIGFLEKEAYKFKKEIIRCLDNNKFVLGVLRKMNDEFLNYIKGREDTLVIDIENIDYKDRKEMLKNIVNILKKEEINT